MISTDKQLHLLITSVADLDQAKTLAKLLVNSKLAACVQCYPQVSSIYLWKGEICEDQEVILHIKCLKKHMPKLEKLIENHHPYDTPELIALPIDQSSEPYLDWIKTSTQP
ncbi:divalent-cation tolerance protein CutA [Parashewanella curva]|uniref:Divalent-cation tolerance protein CutA n=2 Tax=Parashewanella curva TaxID=2338552 RepID=A0A3L8PVU7_9GAMM|nr:divalent-cation tolerance protein CutA [Parashewanella curva]